MKLNQYFLLNAPIYYLCDYNVYISAIAALANICLQTKAKTATKQVKQFIYENIYSNQLL